jgi:hypothetical protein
MNHRVFISAFKKDRPLRENLIAHFKLKDYLHNYSPFVFECIGGYKYEGDDKATEEISCIAEIDLNVALNIAKHFQQESIMLLINSTAAFFDVNTNKKYETNYRFIETSEDIDTLEGYSIVGDKVFTLIPE